MRKNTTFNVGDRIAVREWEDMAEEYGEKGKAPNAYIPCAFNFVSGMRQFCGKEFVISNIKSNGNIIFDGALGYKFSSDMIRHYDEDESAFDIDESFFFELLGE